MEYDFNESEQSVYRLEKEEEKMKERKKKRKKNSRTRTISFETSKTAAKRRWKSLKRWKEKGEKKRRENRAKRARTLLTRNFLPEGRTSENFFNRGKISLSLTNFQRGVPDPDVVFVQPPRIVHEAEERRTSLWITLAGGGGGKCQRSNGRGSVLCTATRNTVAGPLLLPPSTGATRHCTPLPRIMNAH